ncbi:MAG: RHS repeat-associated core domain-containing protein, partial [Actinobacteria bacterium]|nr:RHS repeat-associated core domain-containing protein [Actinomycetota bacterium]
TYAYDSLGRPATVTDPAGRTTTYGHDAGGNMVSKQDPGGNCAAVPKVACTSFGYDVADQLKTITYSDGATPNVTMGYDPNGQRTSMTDGTGSSSWARDSLGRLVASTTGSALPGGSKTVRHGYDLRNSVTSVTYPGNLNLSRAYNSTGTQASQSDWTGASMNFSYDADDNLTGRNVPGTDTSFFWDPAGDLTSIYVNTLILLGIGSLGYTRDDAGQVTSSTGGGPTTESNNYTYTALDQVKTVNGASYNYDAADNLTRLTDGTTQAFSAANQLCWSAPSAGSGCGTPPAGATTYGYDTRGNRTSRTPPPGGAGAASYGYDQANRLTSAPGATYRYRGDGLRLAKTVGGVTTTFNWDESGPLPVLLSETTNGATTRYIYDDKGMPLEQLGTDGVGSYLHHDQLGSVRMITQNGANVMGTFTYDAYGKKTATTGTATTPFGFAGEYTDAETGFQYLRARYYDPGTGQFLSRDPLVALTGSAYGYVNGNPLNGTDPTGLSTCGQLSLGGLVDCVSKTRMPDYATIELSGSVPFLPVLIGGGTLTITRDGHIYVGVEGGVGVPGVA